MGETYSGEVFGLDTPFSEEKVNVFDLFDVEYIDGRLNVGFSDKYPQTAMRRRFESVNSRKPLIRIHFCLRPEDFTAMYRNEFFNTEVSKEDAPYEGVESAIRLGSFYSLKNHGDVYSHANDSEKSLFYKLAGGLFFMMISAYIRVGLVTQDSFVSLEASSTGMVKLVEYYKSMGFKPFSNNEMNQKWALDNTWFPMIAKVSDIISHGEESVAGRVKNYTEADTMVLLWSRSRNTKSPRRRSRSRSRSTKSPRRRPMRIRSRSRSRSWSWSRDRSRSRSKSRSRDRNRRRRSRSRDRSRRKR